MAIAVSVALASLSLLAFTGFYATRHKSIVRLFSPSSPAGTKNINDSPASLYIGQTKPAISKFLTVTGVKVGVAVFLSLLVCAVLVFCVVLLVRNRQLESDGNLESSQSDSQSAQLSSSSNQNSNITNDSQPEEDMLGPVLGVIVAIVTVVLTIVLCFLVFGRRKVDPRLDTELYFPETSTDPIITQADFKLNTPLNSTVTDFEFKDRFIGAMVGLVMGDVYKSWKDSSGKSVRWTSNTSYALCVLASLIELSHFEPSDVLVKYNMCREEGYMNFEAANRNTAISSAKEALLSVLPGTRWDGDLIARLAPIVCFYTADEDDERALRVAVASVQLSASDQSAIDSTACLVFIMRGFIRNRLRKDEVCGEFFASNKMDWYYKKYTMGSDFEATVAAWPKNLTNLENNEEKSAHAIFSCALDAFCTTHDFRSGLEKAQSHDKVSGSVGAVYGQLAGSIYGDALMPLLSWYKSTPRIEDIKGLMRLLWSCLSGDVADNERRTLFKGGRVGDLNPEHNTVGL
jgi:ADP-ribosylglycohydrolase